MLISARVTSHKERLISEDEKSTSRFRTLGDSQKLGRNHIARSINKKEKKIMLTILSI